MAMSRWDPFSDTMTLRDAMDRLFQESFVRPGAMTSQGGMGMAVDLHETEDGYELCASLPGWKPEEINITLQNNTLTISGQHRPEQPQEGKSKSYHMRERRFASFTRSFSFPTPIDADKADARYEHGELTLTLPKAESAKPKQIKVGGGKQMTSGQQPAMTGGDESKDSTVKAGGQKGKS